jgi:hypothetical protein
MLHHRSTQITKGWKKSAIQLVSPSLINLLGTVYGGLTRHGMSHWENPFVL